MVHVSHSGFNLILGLVVSYLSQFCQVWLRIQKAHIHLEQCSIPIGSGLQMQLQGERPEAYHLVRMATKEQFSSHAADPRNCSLPTAFVFQMGSIGLICREGLGLGTGIPLVIVCKKRSQCGLLFSNLSEVKKSLTHRLE